MDDAYRSCVAIADSHGEPDFGDRLRRLERRLVRERQSREEAERLLESKSLELYALNRRLTQLNADLEQRVEERTHALDQERRHAVALAERDMLTGTANRARYVARINEELQAATRTAAEVALLLLDLDRFKQVNDTFGHAYGDELLIAVVARLTTVVPEAALLARLGGDEFAVVIGLDGSSLARSEALAARFQQVLRAPFEIRGRTVSIGCSIGIALFPQHATTDWDLQVCADLALYKVKTGGRAGCLMFAPAMREEWDARRRLEKDLTIAIDQQRIEVFYQPIVHLPSKRIAGVEALARWRHPELGYIPPDRFIGLAEERNLIRGLGKLVLQQSCHDARRWLDRGLIEFFNVNLSPRQMSDTVVIKDVTDALDASGVNPSQLVLEVTEGVMLADSQAVRDSLAGLCARNVSFALDDFGAGYSNLAYLTQLPIQTLKIDRSFVRDLAHQRSASIIVDSLTALAHRLDLKVVVEGVETAAQCQSVEASHCDFGQGYLFGRPMPAARMEERLHGR